ncbi:hypothetical protein NST23_27855 [Brevibacillus sp. FSL K6-0770]|uniref:hypothetical protein n=1 Tax=Brevibacillus sp. FSL K6-0770 TaxID=2954673 RepID=UPI0030F68377
MYNKYTQSDLITFFYFEGNISKQNLLLVAGALLLSTLAYPDTGVAKESSSSMLISKSSNERFVKEIGKYIPKNRKSILSTNDLEKIANGTAQALMESMVISAVDTESPWAEQIKKGIFKVKKIIPVHDLEDRLSEVLVIFTEGFVIVDSDSGELLQFSFEKIDSSYFDNNKTLYSNQFQHFSVNHDGVVIEGKDKGKSIDELKRENNSEPNKKRIINTTQMQNKWENTTEDTLDSLFSTFLSGANEGYDGDYITDPGVWLKKYLENDGYTNVKVSEEYSQSYYVPDINQDDSPWDNYDNDCALISTLEIMNYHSNLSSSNKKKAYDAMIKSKYFVKPDNGVYPWDNANLYKIAANAVGDSSQSTSDDEEIVTPDYDDIKNYLDSDGPGYYSMDSKPYYDHTVTVKGAKEYEATFRDSNDTRHVWTYEFLRINDHWGATSKDAYIRPIYLSTYYVSIKHN